MTLRPTALAVVLLALLTAACTDSPREPAASGTTGPPASSPPGVDPGDTSSSSHRLLLWVNADECATMTDAQLDQWKANGVGGYVCRLQTLSGMTAPNDKSHEWTGNVRADLSAPTYALQRQLAASALSRRARTGELRAFLSFYMLNRLNPRTPLSEWFDDAAWNSVALPKIKDLAGAAHSLGFTGIGFDQELYPGGGTWVWQYPDNFKSESDTRAKVKQRGQQMMRAMLEAFPGIELFSYGTKFPDTWDAAVQAAYRGQPFTTWVQVDLWDGLSSVEGYKGLRFTSEVFYKKPFPAGDWGDAMRYAQNSLQAYLSQKWSNWTYAAPRLFQTPTAWIDGGGGYEVSSASVVAEQFKEFRQWATGGEFYIYTYNPLTMFDYGPYLPSFRAAAEPGAAPTGAPSLSVTSPTLTTNAATVDFKGTANDKLAIRSVTWSDGQGAGGAARMAWEPTAGPMTWTLQGVPLKVGVNTITVTAENIKGVTTVQTLTIASTRPN